MEIQTQLPLADENDRIASDDDMKLALSRIILNPNERRADQINAIKTFKDLFGDEDPGKKGDISINVNFPKP